MAQEDNKKTTKDEDNESKKDSAEETKVEKTKEEPQKDKEKSQDSKEDTKEKTTEKEVESAEDTEENEDIPQEPVDENISEEIEIKEEELEDEKVEIPDFRAGDTVRVMYKIIEGDKTRLQPFEGIVISKKGKGISKTFTVRKIGADNIGVERIFPLHSPNIESLEVKRRGKVRRAKLYYLRHKEGRSAVRVKDRKS